MELMGLVGKEGGRGGWGLGPQPSLWENSWEERALPWPPAPGGPWARLGHLPRRPLPLGGKREWQEAPALASCPRTKGGPRHLLGRGPSTSPSHPGRGGGAAAAGPPEALGSWVPGWGLQGLKNQRSLGVGGPLLQNGPGHWHGPYVRRFRV